MKRTLKRNMKGSFVHGLNNMWKNVISLAHLFTNHLKACAVNEAIKLLFSNTKCLP